LCVLPKEIRQLIYSYILDVERAVTFRYCCGPETTKRERDACQKHRPVAGRFNVLFLSKLIRHEASWVLHNQGSLRIDVTRTIQHYLDGSRAKSLRHMSDSIHKNSKKALMWAAVACYRSIIILVSDRQLRMGDPALFTDHLVEIACLLGKCWEGRIGHRVCAFHDSPRSTRHWQHLPSDVAIQLEVTRRSQVWGAIGMDSHQW
jgi:hypothetical protein